MCNLLDISGADLLGLFKLIDIDKTNMVEMQEFVLSLFRCHAEPQGVDMVRMTKNQAHMKLNQAKMKDKLEYCVASLDRLEGMVAQLLPAKEEQIRKISK